MGYRSDVRIITSKKGFDELKSFVERYLGDRNINYSLLNNFDIFEDRENEVYFGWDCLKWYDHCEGYEDVTAIEDGLEYISDKGYGYRFARLGEEYNDYDERYDDGDGEDWLGWIQLNRYFNDSEVI